VYLRFIWTPEIEEHLAEHGVTVDDYEYAFENCIRRGHSDTSGLPAFIGPALDGRLLFGVFRRIDAVDAEPVTAYFPE
jgi:hypothetical protein